MLSQFTIKEFLNNRIGKRAGSHKLFTIIMRGNQLPVSASRWQHVSQICLATFVWWKITKLLKTQQPQIYRKNKRRFGILRILVTFWCMCWLNLKNQNLLNKIGHRFLLKTKQFFFSLSLSMCVCVLQTLWSYHSI